jgi:hypothetical protein
MPLEVSKDVGGQWVVEIVGNGERACGEPERPGRRRGRRDGADFRDRAAPSDDDDVLPSLDSGEERRSVMGEFLRADSAHGRSLPLRDVAGKGRAKASIPAGNPAVGTEVLADLLLEGDFFVDAHAASRPRLAGRPTDQPVRFT